MYNVFKRPMFKRGGSTQGTGIMSHVERRKNFNAGARGTGASNMAQFLKNQALRAAGKIGPNPMFGPPNPGYVSNMLAKYPRALPLGAYSAAGAAGYGIGALTDFAVRATDTPLAYAERKKIMEEDPYTFDETNDPSAADMRIENLQSIGEQPGFFPRGGRKNFYRKKDLNPETGLPYVDMRGDPAQFTGEGDFTDSDALAKEEEAKELDRIAKAEAAAEKDAKYTESDILSSVEDEKRILDKILPANVSTSEKAFLIAKAMKGETLSDKLDIAGTEGMKLAKGKSARDREKALLAYKGATQKDIAKTQAGKKGSTEKQLDELTNLYKIVNDPKSTEAQKKAANAKLEIKKQVYNILSPKTNQGISNVDKQLLNELGKSAAKLKRLSIDPTSDGYKKALDEYRLTRRAVSKNPTLLDIIQLTDQQVGLEFKKDGGRIGYALGTENPMTTRPAVGQVPTEETSKLSFEDLRNRLPKEITDGVVRLISSSDQALQDFSYIRTQGDVVKFNQKYGVNLVLPAEA